MSDQRQKELVNMLWAVRKVWFARVIATAEDPQEWLQELTPEERATYTDFVDLMHRVTNVWPYEETAL